MSELYLSKKGVVGIHGQDELDFITDDEGKLVDKLTAKTGFNPAIPINTFIAKLSEAGLNSSALLINTSPTANAPLKLNNAQDAKTYYVPIRFT